MALTQNMENGTSDTNTDTKFLERDVGQCFRMIYEPGPKPVILKAVKFNRIG